MLKKLEQVTRSQKVRIMMLFAVLAIVAAVAVLAFDDPVEDQGPPFWDSLYEEYEEGQPSGGDMALSGSGEYEAYEPYYDEGGSNPIYIPGLGWQIPGLTPGETPGPLPGETPGPTPGITPELLPGETPVPELPPGQTPDLQPGETPAPPPGELPEEAPPLGDIEDAYGYEEYMDFDPSGGYIPIVPFGPGSTVTFITNNPHAAAPTPVPGQGSRVTNASSQVGAGNMPNPPTWGGRYFMQWNTSPDGTGTVFTATTNVPGDMNVYAQWAFEITFMGNGVNLVNSGSPNNQTNPTWYGVRRIPLNTTVNANNAHVNPVFAAVWPTDPSPAGFTFMGWNAMPDGSGANLTGATTISAETAAFAQWTLNTSTVTFNPGTGTMSPALEWIPDPANLAGPQIQAPHSLTRTVITGNSIDFSGHQDRQQFRQNTNVAWPRSAPVVVAPASPTAQFLEGWWTQINGYMGAGTRFAPPAGWNSWNSTSFSTPQGIATTAVTGNMTVHAHWVHRVHFQINGATSVGSRFTGGTPAVGTNIVQNQAASSQSQLFIDIPLGNPAATVGTHGRLHRTAPASMLDTYVPLTRLPGSTQEQTVINNAGNPSTGVTVGGTITRAGHTFGGWWIASGGQNTTWAPAAVGSPGHPEQMGHLPFTENTPISALTHANSTVVAHWIPNAPVQITFNPNGGIWSPAAMAIAANVPGTPGTNTGNLVRNVTEGAVFQNCSVSGQTFPPFPTRAGYVFLGWHQIQDPGDGSTDLGTGPITTTIGTVPVSPVTTARLTTGATINGSQTFYARWLPTPVTLIFERNFPGAVGAAIERDLPYGWTMAQMVGNTGWNDSWQGSPDAGRYNWSGWTNSPRNQVMASRSGWTLLGATSAGFNTQPNGLGTSITSGTAVNSSNTNAAGRLYIYAQWGATVTFNSRHETVYGTLSNTTTSRSLAEGHSVSNSFQHPHHPNAAGSLLNNFPGLYVWDTGAIYPSGAPASRTLLRPGTPQGSGSPIASRSFVGWNTATDGSGTWWTADTLMENGNQQVHAIWRPWVNFRPGLGVPTTALSVPFGSLNQYDWNRMFQVGLALNNPILGGTPNMPPDMTNAWLGHTWRGWFPNPDGTGAERDFSAPVFFARTYYASFYAPVTFHANGGVLGGGNSWTQVPVGQSLGQAMPNTLSRTGWLHRGAWNTNPDNTGASYTDTTPIMSGRNLYATWVAQIEFLPGSLTATVLPANEFRFVPEGGTLDENPPGQRMPPNPTNSDPSYDFVGWRIIDSQGHPFIDLTDPPVWFADDIRFNISFDPNTANGSLIVEAVWQSSEVDILFDFAGGTHSGDLDRTYTIPRGAVIDTEIFPIPGDPIVAGNEITRTHFTFSGNWLNPALPAGSNILTTAQVNAHAPQVNTTFIAQWNPNPFTVTFQLDSGTYTGFTPNAGPVVVNNILHLTTIGYLNVPATRPAAGAFPATTFERTGHTFVGWREVDSANALFGPTMSTGAVGLLQISGANRTFRAIWTPTQHLVTFVLSGGNIGGNGNNVLRTVDDGQNVNHANTSPAPGVPAPVRLNRVLQGWLDSAGTMHSSAAVGTMTITAPATFTAVWDYDPVAVTFNLNGGTYVVSGVSTPGPINLSLPAGEEIGLGNVPVPTRNNFTFAGWRETVGGVDTDRDRASTAALTLTAGQPRVFDALWTPITHPVTFVLNGGTYLGSPLNVILTVNQGQSIASMVPAISIPVPINPPLTFLHWVANDGTSMSSLFIANLTVSAPMTFTAVWDHQMVPITFNLNGGTYTALEPGPLVLRSLPAGFNIGLGNIPIPTRTNYTFVSWREYDYPSAGINTDRSRGEVSDLMVVYPVSRTFVAQWVRIRHNVTFQLAGGTYNGSPSDVVRSVRQGETVLDPETTVTNTVPVTINDPLVFQHWVRAGHPGQWSAASVAALVITGPETFTAVWNYRYVDIAFDLNGGSYNGLTGLLTNPRRAGIIIGLGNVPLPERANYTFITWREYDHPLAGDITDRNRNQVANVIPVYNISRTFVAQWERIRHNVTFQLAGGTYSGSPADVVRSVRQAETVLDSETLVTNTIPVPTRLNQNFQHWVRVGHPGQWSAASVAALTITGPEVFTAVWDYLRVNITFNLAGGNVGGALGPITESVRAGVQIGQGYVPVPVRDNYTFVHWMEYDYPNPGDETTRNRQQVSQISPVYGEPRTFVAVWAPINHPVTFMLAGGFYGANPLDVIRIVNQGQNITHVNTTASPTVPVVTRPFQSFVGWRNYDGAIWTPAAVAALTVEGPRIFTAVWDTDLESVTFILGGGNVGGNTSDVQHDLATGFEIGLGNVPMPTRDNYIFIGWQESGAPNRDHHQVAAQVLQPGAPRVFTALWEPILHPVTFVLAGGTYVGSPNAIVRDVQHNSSVPPAQIPTPTNAPQAFIGWHVANSPDIWSPASVAALAVTGPVTFTAVWEYNFASVTFILSGGDVSGNSGPIVHPALPVGVAIGPSNVPVPTWEFRAFAYWAIMDGALVVATHSALEVANIVLLDDMTFTAVWERPRFPITFSFGGGTWGNHNDFFIRQYDNGALVLPNDVPIPERPNYQFLGWQIDGIGQLLQPGDIIGHQVNGPLTIVAVWARLNHPVIYEMNGGIYEGTPNDFLWIVDQGTEIERVPDPTREHYVLIGWREYDYPAAGDYTDRNQGQVAAIEIFGPRTFVAQWERLAHPVTFDLNRGIYNGSLANVVHMINQNSVIGPDNIPTPTLTASTLTGWRIDGSGTVLSAGAIAVTVVTEPLVFIAVWDDTAHPVTFDLNGGAEGANQGPIVRNILEGNTVGTGAIPIPTRENYTLAGWQLDGTGTTLTMTQVANMLVSGPMRFVAVWAPITHPVTFDLDGGEYGGSSDNIIHQVNQGAIISADNVPAPTRGESIFGGWREFGTDVTLTSAQVAQLVVTGPRIFIAQWDVVLHNVTFILNGGTVNDSTDNIVRTVPDGDRIQAANVPQPIRGYFVFAGWEDMDSGGAIAGDREVLTGLEVANITVTRLRSFAAVWTPVSRDVILGSDDYTASVPGHRDCVYVYSIDDEGRVTFYITPPGNGAIFTENSLVVPPPGYIIVDGPTLMPDGRLRVTIMRYVLDEGDDLEFTLIFDPDRGSLAAGIADRVIGPFGHRVETFPTPIPPTGYQFVGWFYNDMLIVPHMALIRDITLVARFAPVDAEMFTVIYDPGPGLLPDGAQSTQRHPYGTQIISHPIPTRTNHIFGGWLLAGVPVDNPLVVTSDKTLTARWVPDLATPSPSPSPTPYITPTPTPLPPHVTPTPTPTPLPPHVTPTPTPIPPPVTPTPIPPSVTPTPTPTPPPPPHVPQNHYVVVFNPHPGAHHSIFEHGIRTGVRGHVITDQPHMPSRPGYIFVAWRFPDGSILGNNYNVVITGNKVMTAVWQPMPGTTPTPSPTPCPSATPGPSTQPSPGPSTQPTPCPSTSPAPSATPAPPGNRPNPQTNPIQVSFMIFGAVMLVGFASVGIWLLTSKQTAAAGKYNKDAARYEREKRIEDMIKGDKRKK